VSVKLGRRQGVQVELAGEVTGEELRPDESPGEEVLGS
jgi:hypothetical protein